MKDVLTISNTKGEEYSGSTDALANFKRNGEVLGLDPKIIWSVYFMKHIDSIMSYTRVGHVQSEEDISGRIKDAITYLILLQGLIIDGD